MIANDAEFERTVELLARMYRVANDVKREHPTASAQWLGILREGWIDQARQLQQQVEEYLEVPQDEASPKVNGVAEAPGNGADASAAEPGRAAS